MLEVLAGRHMRVRRQLFCGFCKLRWKARLDSSHYEEPVHSRINLSRAGQYLVGGVSGPCRACDLFEKRAYLVACAIAQPLLDTIDDRIRIGRRHGVLL